MQSFQKSLFKPLVVFRQQKVIPLQFSGIEVYLIVAGEFFHFLIDKIHLTIHIAFIDHGREVPEQETVSFLTVSQGGRDLAALPALLGLPQGPLHRGAQAGYAVFEDIIRGPALHRVDGHLFTHGPGDEDKGRIRAGGLGQGQGLQAIETREIEVRQDDIRPIFFQRRHKMLLVGDAPVRVGDPGLPQFIDHQLRIAGQILQNQNTQGPLHESLRLRSEFLLVSGGAYGWPVNAALYSTTASRGPNFPLPEKTCQSPPA